MRSLVPACGLSVGSFNCLILLQDCQPSEFLNLAMHLLALLVLQILFSDPMARLEQIVRYIFTRLIAEILASVYRRKE